MKKINLPFNAKTLTAGEQVLISGVIYTARDAALKKFFSAAKLPFSLKGQIIYFAGPTPAKPGEIAGSAGPTSSIRMCPYFPKIFGEGLAGIIGKGNITDDAIKTLRKHGGIYFAAVGGTAALLSRSIKKMECILYPDLGPEAVYKLTIKDFPAVVAIDCKNGNLFASGPKKYKCKKRK
ncbi:MAG: FumA C-terminus/TtdB family hydratase beta subunit [Elusimicrobia bacterium]|nr:FumA C-terminus/TtdB family hydratase beta subunit [Elusimicrobiota bacterium]